MRKSLLVIGLAFVLVGCGGPEQPSNQVAATAKPKKKPSYCFFKDAETKGWAASRGKDGNIVVTGKAYRSDPRYKALLNPATVDGTIAEIKPTISQNDTGHAAADDWWEVAATIPNSAAVDTVKVTCGPKTLAEIKIAPKG
jgi:hypothetical protein